MNSNEARLYRLKKALDERNQKFKELLQLKVELEQGTKCLMFTPIFFNFVYFVSLDIKQIEFDNDLVAECEKLKTILEEDINQEKCKNI